MVDAFVGNEKVWKNQPWPKNKKGRFFCEAMFAVCVKTLVCGVSQLLSGVYILYATRSMGKISFALRVIRQVCVDGAQQKRKLNRDHGISILVDTFLLVLHRVDAVCRFLLLMRLDPGRSSIQPLRLFI